MQIGLQNLSETGRKLGREGGRVESGQGPDAESTETRHREKTHKSSPGAQTERGTEQIRNEGRWHLRIQSNFLRKSSFISRAFIIFKITRVLVCVFDIKI